MTKRSRRLLWFFGIVGVVLLAAYIGISIVLSTVVRSRLQKMVAANLNAELRLGSVRYHFPFGVTVSDASLVSPGPDGGPVELFTVKRVELQLAKLPIGSGPLVIENLSLSGPAVHLIRTGQGIVGQRGLVREPTKSAGEKMVEAADKLHDEKLSDHFRLRHFAIEAGQIIYEDRTAPGAVPTVWKDLAIDLNTAPHSGAIYDYNVTAKNPPLADVTAAGTMDIDEMMLVVERFGLKLAMSPDAPQSPLPAQWQALLHDQRVGGNLELAGNARVPLRTPAQTEYDAKLNLDRGSAEMAQWKESVGNITIALHVTNHLPAELRMPGPAKTSAAVEMSALGTARVIPTAAVVPASVSPATTRPVLKPPMYITVERLEAGTGDSILKLDRGSVLVDPEEGTWRARDLLGTLAVGNDYTMLPTQIQRVFAKIHAHGRLKFTATASGPIKPPPGVRPVDAIQYEMLAQARDTSIHLPRFPLAHTNLTGGLHLSPGLIRLENVEGRYGSDRWFVAGMRIPCNDPDHDVRLQEISGSIDFAPDSPPYPVALGKVLDFIHPGGIYTINGWYVVKSKAPPGQKVDFQFEVSSEHGKLSPTTRRCPLNDVRTELTVMSTHLDVRRLEAAAMGGRLLGSGQVQWGKGKPVTYQAKVQLASMDLKEFAAHWAADGTKPMKLSGKGNLNAAVIGTGPWNGRTTLDNLTAAGEFEVLEGDFWEIPVLQEVASETKAAKDALTVGQAAGTFSIADQTVTLEQFAVSSPVLGVQGNGWVGFDGRLEARAVAAPLADWRDKLKSTGVPILSDAIGEVAGGIQKLINTATGTLLYEFRITGTVGKRQVKTIPAPALSDAAAVLFGNMLNPPKDKRLIDVIRAKEKGTRRKSE